MSERARFNLIMWIAVGVITIGGFCLFFFLRGDYSLVGWMNALFYDGGVILAFGLLAMVANLGAFDMLVYGVRDVFWHMNPSQKKEKAYKDYVDYLEKKKEKRAQRKWSFLWPFLAFGLTLLLASIVLRLIYGADTGVTL